MTIPTVLTSFIGREREMSDARHALQAARLVTLTGAAGCGKTRLALQLVADATDHYVDGVQWVELAPLTASQFVLPAVARALGVTESKHLSLQESLLEALQDKRLLLVLDNCEHLLDACSQLADSIVKTSGVRVLATSREPLGVNGETLYPVTPLSLPPPDLTMEDADAVGQFEAIQLFEARAQAILPGFELTPGNAAVVAGLCRQLDGIPLAIELAAARVNVLTVEQIAARLENRFELLDASSPASASHHRTLRAAIDWSYDLLPEPEQIMLRRLSVFSGGCSLTTAETVCAGDGIERDQILGLLASLVNKSLVMAETLRRSEARYSLLETIREYGREQLAGLGEWAALRDRHLQCFLALTEETDSQLRGPYQLLWLNWLDGEYDNIRAALAWSQQGGSQEIDRVSAGLRIANALYQFWRIRDYVDEGLDWYGRLLGVATDEVAQVVRANALSYASLLAGVRGHQGRQRRYGERAIALGEAAGEAGKPALAMALGALAYTAWETDDLHNALALARRELKLYRELADEYLLGISLSLFSQLTMSQGEYREARAMLDEALPLLRETGDTYRIAMAYNAAGDLARCEGDFDAAESAYRESEALLREIEAVRDLASVLHNLGHARLRRGDSAEARVLFQESMALHQDQHNALGMAACLLGFAALAISNDRPTPGARLLAAAAAHGGKHITSKWAATRLEYEHYLSQARARLPAAEFQIEQEAGGRLTLDEAASYALEVAEGEKLPSRADELTPRERQVAALIAQTRSNGEIAEELVVSKRTVESHIANIRSKLGFTERAQIVRWAIETGLVDISE